MQLKELAFYVTEKIDASKLTKSTFVGVDNMLPEKGGIRDCEYLPKEGLFTKFVPGDILIGNIRPYFKKIWYADRTGGASSDVLVIRGNSKIDKSYLYCYLSQDSFFDYDMAGSKGSKMPRGDKNHIMNFEVNRVNNEEIIGSFFLNIISKIQRNKQINDNLAA